MAEEAKPCMCPRILGSSRCKVFQWLYGRVGSGSYCIFYVPLLVSWLSLAHYIDAEKKKGKRK